MTTVQQNLLNATALLVQAAAIMSSEQAPRAKRLDVKPKAVTSAPAAKPAKKKQGAKAAAAAKTPAPAKAPAAATKAKVAKAAAPAKEAAKKTPRVADGSVPTLTQRLREVLGSEEVGIPEAIKRLKARGKNWVPKSGDLRAYISLALSTHKDDFVRVSRGVYKVLQKGAVQKSAGKAGKAKGGKAKQKPEASEAKAEAAPAEKVETKAVADATEKVETKAAAKPEKAEKPARARKVSNGASDIGGDGNVLDNPFSPGA